MNATKVSDLNIDLLLVELAILFPDSKDRVSQYMIKDGVNNPNGISLWVAIAQYAWRDVSWGWVSEEWGDKIQNNTGVKLVPCSQGGYLIQESTSIGD
jgi:hypothetical protein